MSSFDRGSRWLLVLLFGITALVIVTDCIKKTRANACRCSQKEPPE